MAAQNPKHWLKLCGVTGLAIALSGCLGGNVSTGATQTAVTGTAAGSTASDTGQIERCEETIGTLAVDDGRRQTWWYNFYRDTQVTTIEPMLRLAIQQSNCFVITSIGNERLEDRMSDITETQRSDDFRAGSNQQAGQRVAADYFLEPAIIINDDSAGSIGGQLGGLLGNVVGGSAGSTFGRLAGGLESKVSVVTLSLFDIRSQVQLAVSEGTSTATNYGAAAGVFGSQGSAALGGMSRTPEGKATVAAFVDSFNSMVVSLKNYTAQNVEGGLGTGGKLKVN